MAWVWAAGDALFCTGWVADRSADRRTTDARETGAGLLRASSGAAKNQLPSCRVVANQPPSPWLFDSGREVVVAVWGFWWK